MIMAAVAALALILSSFPPAIVSRSGMTPTEANSGNPSRESDTGRRANPGNSGPVETHPANAATPLPEPRIQKPPRIPALPANRVALPPYPAIPAEPLVPWDATESDLRAIRASQDATPREKSEAGQRLMVGFHKWRGRNGTRLGGFRFQSTDYSMLDGWDVKVREVWVPPSQVPPSGLSREILLSRLGATLQINVHVAISAGLAQEFLMGRFVSSAAFRTPTWGDDLGVAIGDVWLTRWAWAYGTVSEGSYRFARRNVAIEVSFESGDAQGGPALDLMKLGERIDQQVIAQGHQARTWADLEDVCPAIVEFDVDDRERVVDPKEPWPPGRPDAATTFGPWKLRLQVEPRAGMELEYFNPSDAGQFIFLGAPRNTDGSPQHGNPPFDRAFIKREVAIDRLRESDTVTTSVWLLVVDKHSLLFSVAKLDLTLKR